MTPMARLFPDGSVRLYREAALVMRAFPNRHPLLWLGYLIWPCGKTEGMGAVWKTDPDERAGDVGAPPVKQSTPESWGSAVRRSLCETTELWGRQVLARQAVEAVTIGDLERVIKSQAKQSRAFNAPPPPVRLDRCICDGADQRERYCDDCPNR